MKYSAILLLITANLFLACKKDRICSCTSKETGTSTTTAALTFSTPLGSFPVVDTSITAPYGDVFNYERKYQKVTRRQAKNNCVSYTEPFKDKIVNEAPPLQLTTEIKGTREVSCELK
jgi:hypothetical protein